MKKREFLIGCNYWASNAGCFMWKKFDAEVIEKDIRFLKEYGVNCLRVFPTWDDFQPLKKNPVPESTFYSKFPLQVRVNEQCMLSQKYQSGLSEEKLDEFKILLTIAKKYDMKIIVSFITGWMSGRRFVPTAFLEKDLVADPEVLVWQCKFLKDMIAEIKGFENIIAYEPGNECNCLSVNASPQACEAWMMTISNTIRLADNTRPVYAGVHGTQLQGKWNLLEQSEYVDCMTTHPYPLFTPYCNNEGICEMRASLHAAIESAYYRGIANKDCLVEEIGTLGPMILSDDFADKYFERSLLTSLALGTNGYLWWTAFDQNDLHFAPYDVNSIEQNLGMAYSNEKAKPILHKMKEKVPLLKELGVLPPPNADGVVVLLANTEPWLSVYGAGMLAIQSGRIIDYVYEEQKIKDSDYYIIPCIKQSSAISKVALDSIFDKVQRGANLLITYDGGGIGRFEQLTGLKVAKREECPLKKMFIVNGKQESIQVVCNLTLVASTAEVLLYDNQGNVLLSKNKVGEGSVMFFNAPLETFYTKSYMPENTALYEIYKLFFKGKGKVVSIDSNRCLVTQHLLGDNRIAITINSYEKEKELAVCVEKGWNIVKNIGGALGNGKVVLENSFAYFELEKKQGNQSETQGAKNDLQNRTSKASI